LIGTNSIGGIIKDEFTSFCLQGKQQSQPDGTGFCDPSWLSGGPRLQCRSTPSGNINPKAIASMLEVGYDLSIHESKSLEEIPNINFDAVITMGCGDECPWIPGELHEDWEIPDPRDMNEDDFREVRDEIEAKVINLLQRI
jgi:protein-tyrosine-phosphatase